MTDAGPTNWQTVRPTRRTECVAHRKVKIPIITHPRRKRKKRITEIYWRFPTFMVILIYIYRVTKIIDFYRVTKIIDRDMSTKPKIRLFDTEICGINIYARRSIRNDEIRLKRIATYNFCFHIRNTPVVHIHIIILHLFMEMF